MYFEFEKYSVFTYNLVFNKYLNNKVKTHFFYSKNNSARPTVLLYLLLLGGEDPVVGQVLESVHHLAEHLLTGRLKEPGLAVLAQRVLALGDGARRRVRVEAHIVEVVVELALAHKELLVVGLVEL